MPSEHDARLAEIEATLTRAQESGEWYANGVHYDMPSLLQACVRISRDLLARVRELEALLRQRREAAEIAKVSGLELARKFHDTYERLAPSFSYETRKDTKAFDPESANGKLMIAVCDEIGNEIETNAFKAGFNAALHYQHAYSTDIACRAAHEPPAKPKLETDAIQHCINDVAYDGYKSHAAAARAQLAALVKAAGGGE